MENFVTINSLTAYQHSQALTGATVTKTSVAEIRADAISHARSAAESAATVGTPSPGNGGSIGNVIQFGRSFSGVEKHTSTKYVTQIASGWNATASCYKTTSGTGYQLKINFTLPEGIQSSNINNAKLSFKYSALYGDLLAAVLAPATNSEQTSYLKPVGSTTAAIVDNQFTISYNGDEPSEIEDIDITNSFKACLDNQQGWITLSCPSNSISNSRRILVLNEENSEETSVKISYELDATPCVSPDPSNISMTSIVAPGGNLEISWSGATSGINNNIAGYSVCYKLGEDGVWAEPETISLSPTVSGQDGSRSVTFQIPTTYPNPNVYRGKTIYVAITTLGEYGSEFNSTVNISDGKINSLPEAPSIISVDKTRLKSTGNTNVTFVINPGADNDDPLQGKSIKYSFTTSGTKSNLPNDGVITISSENNTIYFWTYDGLEYSSSYTQQNFMRNTAPQITRVTMTGQDNYLPKITINNIERNYVKNITGAVESTGYSGATFTYVWEIQTQQINTSLDPNGWATLPSSINTSSPQLSKTDVTLMGVNFNTAYRLKVTITDDIGESAVGYSRDNEDNEVIFVIAPAPTISSIINNNSDNDLDNTNKYHFRNGIRIKYSGTNTGIIDKVIEYSTSYNGVFTSEGININNQNGYTDISLPEDIFIRGTSYYFHVIYKLNTNDTGTISEISNSNYYYDSENTKVTNAYYRANNLKPNYVTVTPVRNVVRPYTDQVFTCAFDNQPNAFISANDVSETITNNYSIKLIYRTNNPLNINIGNASVNNGVVTFSALIGQQSPSAWESLIGVTDLNSTFPITIELTVTNGFEETFKQTSEFNISFVEGFRNNGQAILKIQTGENRFTTIPAGEQRYSLFQSQTIGFEISGIQCYARQKITFTLYQKEHGADSWEEMKEFVYNNLTDWTGSASSWTLTNKIISYTINNVITSSYNVDFYVQIALGNGQSHNFSPAENCRYRRIQTSEIKPSINEVTENAEEHKFLINGTIGDYGGDGAGPKSGGYSNITLQYIQCATPSGEYQNLGSSFSKTGTNSISINQENLSDTVQLNSDIVYIGLQVNLTLAFETIEIENNVYTPTGNPILSTLIFKNLGSPFYRETPNLLYGKNFFGINTSSPLTNISDQVLEIHQIGNRNKIYFYNGSHYIQLPDGVSNKFTIEGLVIDCGTWNSN